MNIINLQNIGKSYLLGEYIVPALQNINLKINQGAFWGIFGESGSGKSTLLNILGILDKQTSGDYYFENKNINDYTNQQMSIHRCYKIGMIFQSFNLFPELSIFENIAIPMLYANANNKDIKERVNYLAEQVDIHERLKHRPNQLSGGQRQRVAIARSLANDPPVLLADEPTGNLDEKTGEIIIQIFQRLVKENKTVIMVTHNKNYHKIVEHSIILKDGKIIKEN